MKKFLTLMAVATTAMCFTGCSKSDGIDDEVDNGSNKPVEIKVGGRALSITPGANTRTPVEDGTAAYPLIARVLASNTAKKYVNSPTDLLKDGTMEFSAAATSIGFKEGPVLYPNATAPVYLVGLYPALQDPPARNWTIDTNGDKASYEFEGSQDVMATNEVTTTRSDIIGNNFKTLTFHHLLTRLNLIVQAEDATAKGLWGDVKSIKVKSPNNLVTVTFKTEDSTVPTYKFDGGDTDLSFFNTTNDIALENDTPLPLPVYQSGTTLPAQSYSLVAPKVGGVGAPPSQVIYELIVTTTEHPNAYTVTVPLKGYDGSAFTGDTQGEQFTITLSFNTTEIKAKANVTPWGPGGSGSGTVE